MTSLTSWLRDTAAALINLAARAGDAAVMAWPLATDDDTMIAAGSPQVSQHPTQGETR